MTFQTENFYKWLRQARPGDVCIYHTGLLMFDRYEPQWDSGGAGRPSFALRRNVEDMRLAVLTAARLGDVLLTQRRLSPGHYEYLATRTGKDRAI